MNITKTLCLCAALSGAAGIQAMENCELVTKQDNTRVNTYQTNRPEVSKRLFVSQEVEQQIARIKQLLTNAKLAWMFENCFPNTLDTTVILTEKRILSYTPETSTPCGFAIPVPRYGRMCSLPIKTPN